MAKIIHQKNIRKGMSCLNFISQKICQGATIAMCLKGSIFDDSLSIDLLEWILMAFEQKFAKIFIYLYSAPPFRIEKIMK